MGFNHNQTLKNFCTFIFFFLLFISFACSSPCHDETKPRNSPSVGAAVNEYQVLYSKKSRPFFLNNQERMNQNRKKTRERKRKKSSPFSVMLPKGFVPPSGSSPCHNMKPDVVAFYCHLSSPKP
ncbi:putative Nuclear receptor coactivator 6 [Melia azedarach]|uniref:Nuclear receptor coactivator 6 n=1 Tax=Melia azedarach TaxID=155640 RepID=A0ACC1WY56_MELAZ|nr:putative Nuclear receptor coactivator 6 [Melia azedarach]